MTYFLSKVRSTGFYTLSNPRGIQTLRLDYQKPLPTNNRIALFAIHRENSFELLNGNLGKILATKDESLH